MGRRRSDGYQALVDPEDLGALEVPYHLLAVHRDLVDLGDPFVPLPPCVPDVDLPHEALFHHGSKDPHQWLPRNIGAVHDTGRLGRASLDDLEGLEIDLQFRPAFQYQITPGG